MKGFFQKLLKQNNDNNNNNDFNVGSLIKAKIKAMIVPILMALAPIVIQLLLFLVVIVFIYSSWSSVTNFFEGIWQETESFVEKMGNFLTFKGWSEDDQAFYTHLEKEYDEYNNLGTTIGELDIPLVMATLHYNKVIDVETYIEDDTIVNEEDSESYEPGTIIGKSESKYFYDWAYYRSGSYNSLINPGLLGNMVSRTLVTECKEGSWLDSIAEGIRNSASEVLAGIQTLFEDGAQIISGALYEVYMHDVNVLGFSGTFKSWYDQYVANVYTSADSFKDLFDFSYVDLQLTCGEGEYASTTLKYFIDYEKYNKYLEMYFVPTYYMNCKDCKWAYMEQGTDEYNNKVQDIIDEIYTLREFYVEEEAIQSTVGLGTITTTIDGFVPRTSPPRQSDSHDRIFWWEESGIRASLWGQCTWYVVGRVNEIMDSMGSSIRITNFPNAKNWITSPAIVGGLMFSSSTNVNEPKIGAIIVWGASGYNQYGHVAVIENVYEENGETHVVFSHANTHGAGAIKIPGNTDSSSAGTWQLVDTTISGIQQLSGMNFLGYIYTIDY